MIFRITFCRWFFIYLYLTTIRIEIYIFNTLFFPVNVIILIFSTPRVINCVVPVDKLESPCNTISLLILIPLVNRYLPFGKYIIEPFSDLSETISCIILLTLYFPVTFILQFNSSTLIQSGVLVSISMINSFFLNLNSSHRNSFEL
ncbi:putative membrane protein [Clostridioides difficile Y343]|nr:putative membrane protein [Clostridioides difficile Y343]